MDTDPYWNVTKNIKSIAKDFKYKILMLEHTTRDCFSSLENK